MPGQRAHCVWVLVSTPGYLPARPSPQDQAFASSPSFYPPVSERFYNIKYYQKLVKFDNYGTIYSSR